MCFGESPLRSQNSCWNLSRAVFRQSVLSGDAEKDVSCCSNFSRSGKWSARYLFLDRSHLIRQL